MTPRKDIDSEQKIMRHDKVGALIITGFAVLVVLGTARRAMAQDAEASALATRGTLRAAADARARPQEGIES